MITLRGATMGTTWSLILRHTPSGDQAAQLGKRIQCCLDDLCQQMSHWQTTSLISQINAARPGWYALPDDFFIVLSAGLTVSRQTRGAYDPTLGVLSNLWGFGPEEVHATRLPPSPYACRNALQHCGYQRTCVHHYEKAVWQPGGLHFDLSSIAKGYALDKVDNMLRTLAYNDFLLEIGGELKARGKRNDTTAWLVQIELPGTHPGTLGITVPLRNRAVATSGNYRRVLPGTRYGHTLSSQTGKPVDHTLLSVTVAHTDCMMADALASALLVLGPHRAQHYAAQHGLAALFIHESGSIDWTPEFESLACPSTN